LKKEEIDSKIKRVLVEESNILKQINIEYPFYIRNLFQKFPHIFDRKPKILFHELFADKVSLPYRLTVKVETPVKEKHDDTEQDKKEIKTKTEYKVVKVDIKLRESVRLKFMNKTTVLDRKTLNDFMAENVESSDLFWMLHIAIHKVIQQELNIIKQEQRDK
jgi:hypothetical protein